MSYSELWTSLISKSLLLTVLQSIKPGANAFKVPASGVSDMGAVRITEDKEKYEIVEEYEIAETGAKIDDEGVPEDSLKIGVTTINARTGAIGSSEIYTKATESENSGAMISKI